MTASKPLIGITASYDEAEKRTWIRTNYMNSIIAAGAVPILLPVTGDRDVLAAILSRCDGLLLSGGPDVDPSIYGAADPDGLAVLCPARDTAEIFLCREAIRRDLPILAICRGIQVLNVTLGGTLWIDLPAQRPSTVTHRQATPFDVPVHSVRLLPDSPLCGITGRETLAVNSMHHQAIRDLGSGLRPMGEAEDGLTEAVWMPEKRWVLGVQWHPEWLSAADSPSRRLFSAFAQACQP
ncbi:MAG: gamma-glutamyl-gamma-aminobutyrate hydrolase family protein [Clostridia bacterium]|nr:gamma-glutamyl-gamma-aminobutyrate hydrolase family protein [Clostridia bacterium]